MAKNDKKNNKKVPGALVVAVVVIIAIAAFVPSVYMPYKNKKPTMDAEHQEALSTIAYLDESIAQKDVIQADIDDLTKQWEEYRKNMFVEPETALDDVNKAGIDLGIKFTTFNRSKPQEDSSGTVTSEGNPLYYVTLDIQCDAEREQIIDLLKYIEQESVGCYYVKSLDTKPIPVSSDSDSEDTDEEDSSDTDKKKNSDKDKNKNKSSDSDSDDPYALLRPDIDHYDVKMKIFLYYFNQDVVIAPEVVETDTDSN